MALDLKPGQTVRVTIAKHINRDSARKTLERVFMTDRAVSGQMEARTRNFKDKPKRRGGRIYTKRPNKPHLPLLKGHAATVTATTQAIKDLQSVEAFIEVQAQ